MKKVFAVVLCGLLFLGILPFGVGAEEEGKPSFSLRETVMQQAHDSYYRSRKTAGRLSFHGTCGLMVSHQLYNLGINKRCVVLDGNDHYDYYSDLEKTTGGYYINTYPAEGYSLREALLAVSDNGKRDVRNVLVGFQWTNTEAGARYGHVMLINGIVGGTVYFVESYDCALGGTEGMVISCSIDEFAKYYDKWTVFEGLIHFGMGTYHDVCPNISTDLTVQARFPTILRSEPVMVGRQDCVRLRSVAAGERLRVTAIYEAERAYYYRVETNEGYGFIAAGAVSLLQVNTEGVTLSGAALPRQMQSGAVPAFAGTVMDNYGSLSSVEVCITDTKGQLIRRELAEVQEDIAQLKDLRDGLFFDLLEPGEYQLDIYASRACPAVIGNHITSYYTRVQLDSRRLQVGGNPRDALQNLPTKQVYRDGWFRDKGTWYCYENGQPCTGWVTHLGVRYYLKEDGSVTVGAQNVDGQQMYFSVGGALVTGWLTLEGKTGYRAADGTAVIGWQTIDGKLYCFGEDGVMLTDTEQIKDKTTYLIAKDGTATEKQEAQNG